VAPDNGEWARHRPADNALTTIGGMLYGRDAERARIREVLDRAGNGQSAVLVVRGEAGVGKSALLEDAREQAAGMTVLSGSGVESETQLPYAGLHQLLRPVLDHLDALPDPQARALRGALGLGTGVGDEWFLVSAAVLSLLAEAAERKPVVCLVDDAHWLDDASAEALVFAARRLAAEPIALIFAARESDVRSFDAPGLEELRLAGLDRDAATALLDQRAGVALSPDARQQLIEQTEGNPLALLALSSSLSDAQMSGAEPLIDPLPVTEQVERVFLSRVRSLPDDTQTLLLVAAADDTGTVGAVLPAAVQLGAGPESLDAAEQAALVRVRGERIDFLHPLVRSAIYHGAPLSRRQAAHRALAAVLVDESNADRRAWHLAAGTVQPDASVVDDLEQAALRARQRSGFVPASLAFERAATITADDRRRLRLLIDAVESAWLGGRLERALVLLERARPLAGERAERADIDRWRGLIEVTVGVPADAREVLVRGALEIAEVDHEQALQMLATACLAAGYSGDAEAVVATAQLADQIPATERDGPVSLFLAQFVRGAGSYFAGAFETAAPSLRAALEMAEGGDVVGSSRLRLLVFAGGAGLFLGDDRAAERFNRRLVAHTRETGAVGLLTEAVPRLALSQIATGYWPGAAANLEEGIDLARQTGQQQVLGHMLSELALIAALRGEDQTCRSLAAESHELASARGLVHVEQTSRWALLALALGRGDVDGALICARDIARCPVALWAALDRIEAAVRAGEAQEAAGWLESFEAWADGGGVEWGRAVALHCRALLCDDDEESERMFATALAAHTEAGRPFERARTELAYGEFLRRARQRVEAREHLRAALDGFENLGATLWAERAEVELRASGQTARKRDPSTRDELSPQEMQIARFVAQGLSNREVAAQLFLSPRTIDFHLRNVFRKLGLTSRTQLAHLELDAGEREPAQVA
jgi:DNA-binding CsgD family transcriptional regulator